MKTSLILNLITATTATASAVSNLAKNIDTHNDGTKANTGLRGQRRLPGIAIKPKTSMTTRGGESGHSKQKHVKKEKGGNRAGFNFRQPVDDSAEVNEMVATMAMEGEDEDEPAFDRMDVAKKGRGREKHHKEKGHKTETAAEDSYPEEDSRMRVVGKGKHSEMEQQKRPKNEMRMKTEHVPSEAESFAEKFKFEAPDKKKGRKHVTSKQYADDYDEPENEIPMDSRMKVHKPSKGGSRTKKEKNAPAPSPKDTKYAAKNIAPPGGGWLPTPSPIASVASPAVTPTNPPVAAIVVTPEPTTSSSTAGDIIEAVSAVDVTTTDPTSTTTPEAEVAAFVYPPCPPSYNSSLVYAAGDEIGMNGHTWMCLSAPYEEYCNIEEKDELWDEQQEMYYKKAWDDLGPCGEPVAEAESMVMEAYSSPVTTTVASVAMVAESVDTTTAAATTVASTTPEATSTTSTATTTTSTSTTTEAETEAPTERPTEAPTGHPITNMPTDAPTEAPVAATTTTTTTTTTTSTTTTSTTEEPTTTTTTATTTEDFLTSTVLAAPEEEPSPTLFPTFMPTISPPPTPTPPVCPPAYDTSKMDYVAGQVVEVHEHIFQCHLNDDEAGVNYEPYCNAAQYNKALGSSDHWKEAWVHVGGCNLALASEVLVLEEALAEAEVLEEAIEVIEEELEAGSER